jgi:hypothetical protein
MPYEVERKVEITEAERDALITLFEKEGFVRKPSVLQNDHYIHAVKSSLGGYDLKRYRDEGEKIFYTEKVWENIDGQNGRREIEKQVTHDEMISEVSAHPLTLTIQKKRQPFVGTHEGVDIHIDMDEVKFDHSLMVRFFVEAETITAYPDLVKHLALLMLDFLRESLGREVVEAPGMFTMAFEKL